jgi:hypothetical protein
MGAASGGFCHVDAAAAAAYYCASAFPQLQNGSVVSCSGTSGTTLTLGVSTIPAGCTGTCTPTTGTLQITPSVIACDQTDWLRFNPLSLSAADGLLIATAVVGLWLAAWAIKAAARALRTDGERE